ncbi:hypothetical protein D6C89_07591 [Aureobasidium pullulans]|nr:hypothetical protein D6C89_07591 [Aureobasidium pullulans]
MPSPNSPANTAAPDDTVIPSGTYVLITGALGSLRAHLVSNFAKRDDVRLRLLESVTCIVYNAWTISAKRPIAGFEAQFEIMGNLLYMSSEIAALRPRDYKTRFVFVSSIAVKDTAHVLEERVTIEAVLPNGYSDAKWAYELVLDRTLYKASLTLNITCTIVDLSEVTDAPHAIYNIDNPIR